MNGIDFNEKRDKGELKKDDDFKDSIWEDLEYTDYLCPVCSAHLKEAENGYLICLNGCHMSKGMMDRFSSMMHEISEKDSADKGDNKIVQKIPEGDGGG